MGNSERVGVSMGADSARKRTLWGSSALEMGDHCLLEDGGERRGALGSDSVVSETVRARGGVGMVRVGVSIGIDTKANTLGRSAHLRWVICVSLRMAASPEAPSSPMAVS